MADNTPVAELEQKPKAKFPLKTILIIAGVLLMEGGTITMFKIMGGGPKPAEGTDPIAQPAPVNPVNEVAEVLLADGSVDNYVSGRSLIRVDLEIHAKIKKADQEKMKLLAEEHKTEIRDRIRFLVSSSQPEDLRDPKLQVIKREIKTTMDEILGPDMIQEIFIPMWQSYAME